MRITTLLFLGVAFFTACNNDPGEGDPDAGPECPATLPVDGADCADVGLACDDLYVAESCECGPSDIYNDCTCTASGWECELDGADCYPCEDAGPAACPAELPGNGDACPEVGLTCNEEYVIQECVCGPDDVTWHCTCTEDGWSCDDTVENDCYPCPDAGVDP